MGDDGGDATLFIHKCKENEDKQAKDGSVPDPTCIDNRESMCIFKLPKNALQADKTRCTRMAAKCKDVSEGMTMGAHGLKELAARKELLFPAVNVDDCVTKSKLITEIDPTCALQAGMVGFQVVTMK